MTDAKDEDEFYAAIDAESADDDERQDSKVVYQALKGAAGELGGASEIPAADEHLSEQIRAAATVRSQEIQAASASMASSRLNAEGKPIPAWMWLLWIVAIIGAVVGLSVEW